MFSSITFQAFSKGLCFTTPSKSPANQEKETSIRDFILPKLKTEDNDEKALHNQLDVGQTPGTPANTQKVFKKTKP